MNENVTISVIVPVYNTEKYLDDCFRSIINQSHKNLQVIVVDDGSTDGSSSVCDAWACRDPRILVIHQNNAGVSSARNTGLQYASGDLISFVDSDDVLAPDAYLRLLQAKKNSDLVMGGIQLMAEDGTMLPAKQFPSKSLTLEMFMQELFQESQGCYLGFLCDKLLENRIIRSNNLSFDPGVKLNEDRLFLLKYLIHSHSVSFVDEVVYYYRQRNSGAIVSTRRDHTVTDSEMTVIDSFRKMLSLTNGYSRKLNFVVARKAFESSLDLRKRVSSVDKRKVKQIRQFMWDNALVYLQCPSISILEKMKIIGHCILEQ